MTVPTGNLRNICFCAFVMCADQALSASVPVQVLDSGGAPLADAVVFLEPVLGRAPPLRSRTVEIEQKNRRFTQVTTVVQVGQAISFPNNDGVRHHVYSLSQAKLFELKLYSGVPEKPVVFDKPGVVVIGCNIHDKMVAYIRVVDTPWFGQSDGGGRIRIDGLPDGQYKLRVWHSGLANLESVVEQTIQVKGEMPMIGMRLDVKAAAR